MCTYTLTAYSKEPENNTYSSNDKPVSTRLPSTDSYAPFRAYGRQLGKTIWNTARSKGHAQSPDAPGFQDYQEFATYGMTLAEYEKKHFLTGRYNRSRARLPEHIGHWRKTPNAANPGADSANFPNSPFTLPEGRAYVELSPYTYSGSVQGSPGQYNTEFLLRYGFTDNIEFRLFGSGLSWAEGGNSSLQMAPIGFDTKILLWPEQPKYYLPAVGFEASVQTELFGSSSLNAGNQPAFTLNFDQSLPYDIDFGYSVSATRFQGNNDNNLWAFLFQWAFQRELFSKDFALFVHGFYQPTTVIQNAVGAGFVWTPHRRFGFYGQISGGTTKETPSVISNVGFVIAF